MEEEDKISIEEATVNLSCVKKELEECEFAENQYRIALTYENVFGNSMKEKRENIYSLIGFLDDDVIMESEMGTIKLEDVKDGDHIREVIEQPYCNGCRGNYVGYCPNCSSISHILNNVTSNINLESDLNTTPIDILEIREIAMKRAVYTLKAIPKSIILGPFEGIAPIKGTNGLKWKIKDKKLVNNQNANWMKYITSVTNPFLKNLDIFQFEGLLYFETSREILEGEELLVCYHEEKEVLKSDNDEESYLVPVVKDKFPKVFACTLCCLGFHLEQCLVEHKSKCPQGGHGSSIEDFKIIQCQYCKLWLKEQEHLEGHMLHCLDYCNKARRSFSHLQPTQEIATPIDGNARALIGSGMKQSKRSYGISGKTDVKRQTIYSKTEEKKYKCSKCPYQTNYKQGLKVHLNTHSGIKPFECDVCKRKFSQKGNLNEHIRNRHIKNRHSISNEKEYKCPECSYQTNYKSVLNQHTVIHSDIKPFECNICERNFNRKGSLKIHIKNYHSKSNEKEYKCSECSLQTNSKGDFNRHILIHRDIKPFECNICERNFNRKGGLMIHIKNYHSKSNEKEYKCSECSFQTNYKHYLNRHIFIHSSIKPFECYKCERKFSRKDQLQRHIKNRHSSSNEMKYKCPECSFQTNYKSYLSIHASIHIGIHSGITVYSKKQLKYTYARMKK